MNMLAIKIIILIIICLLPILLWGYLFVYLGKIGKIGKDTNITRKEFIVGMFSGGISVFMVMFTIYILELLENTNMNIIFFLYNTSFILSIIFFSLLAICIGILSLLILGIISPIDFFKKYKLILRNIIIFSLFGIIFYFINIILSLNIFNLKNYVINNDINYFLNTLFLASIYYIFIAFIEESSKHFSYFLVKKHKKYNLNYKNNSKTIKKVKYKNIILITVTIALGFSFIENILYLYKILFILETPINTVITTYILRNLLSVIIHISSSLIITIFFINSIYIFKNKTKNKIKRHYLLLIGIFIAICYHAIYDISIVAGYKYIFLALVIIGYMFNGYIFYGKNIKNGLL